MEHEWESPAVVRWCHWYIYSSPLRPGFRPWPAENSPRAVPDVIRSTLDNSQRPPISIKQQNLEWPSEGYPGLSHVCWQAAEQGMYNGWVDGIQFLSLANSELYCRSSLRYIISSPISRHILSIFNEQRAFPSTHHHHHHHNPIHSVPYHPYHHIAQPRHQTPTDWPWILNTDARPSPPRHLLRQTRKPRRMANGHQSPRRQPVIPRPDLSFEIHL